MLLSWVSLATRSSLVAGQNPSEGRLFLHGASSIPHVLTRCVRQELGFSHLGGSSLSGLGSPERLLRNSRELKAIGLVMRYFQQQCWQTFDRMSLPKEGGRYLYPSHNREAQVFLRWAEGTGLSLNPSPSWGIRVWWRTLCPGPSRSLEQSSHSVWTSSTTFCRLACDGFLFATSLSHSFRYTVLLSGSAERRTSVSAELVLPAAVDQRAAGVKRHGFDFDRSSLAAEGVVPGPAGVPSGATPYVPLRRDPIREPHFPSGATPFFFMPGDSPAIRQA